MNNYSIHKKRVVGVEVSNERTTYAIVDIRGNIFAKESFDTRDHPDINEFVTVLSERIIAMILADRKSVV